MFRIALLTARSRPGTFVGALLAFAASAVLVMAGGMLVEAALRTHPPVERYSGAAAVVMGKQNIGPDHDVVLEERPRISAALVARLAATPGVSAAIPDVAFPAGFNGRSAEGHGWSAARLTPYALTAGRPPATAGEIVAGFPAKLGSHVTLTSSEAARTVTVVGIARPRHPVTSRDVVFVDDAEATRLAGHPGQVDSIGIIAGPGFDASRLHAAAGDAQVLTGQDRGRAQSPEQQAGRTRLIAVAASFAGMGIFIALFVVSGTMSLAVQQREQEIALLRAIAATPRQVRRMIMWEATLIAVIGSAAGIWPGLKLGQELADRLVAHGIAPQTFVVSDGKLAAARVIVGAVLIALLSVWSAGRRASRVAPTRALADAAVEPQLISRGRLIGGLIALAGAVPLFLVASTTTTPATAAACSEMTAMFLVAAAGYLGPVVARFGARLLQPVVSRVSPIGGFLATANFATMTRRFSSASTPIVLTVAMSCTLLFSTTTIDQATSHERHAGLSADLAVTSAGTGLPVAALSAVRATHGVQSAVALTPTTLGPSLGVSDDTLPAFVVSGGRGGGFNPDVTAGSLADLHGATIAISDHRAESTSAHVDSRVPIMLGDGARATATVVAIYKRSLAFGEALLSPELAAGHVSSPLLSTILVRTGDPSTVARRIGALAANYPGLRVRSGATVTGADEADREANRWLGPLFVAIIFAFTAIAIVNTLVMIAIRRGRELSLVRLTGATNRQVRSMARWEAVLIVAIGLGVGLAIAATALLPLSHALTGGLKPDVPMNQLGAILGISAILAFVALAVPTRRMLRTRPIDGVQTAE